MSLCSEKIDEALKLCVSRKKPVYLELPCNLVTEAVPRPEPVRMIPEVPILPVSDEVSLECALRAICDAVDGAERVLLVAGPKLRTANAIDNFAKLAETLGCCVTVTPDAKSMFDEYNENFLGYYWGPISNRNVKTAMKEADLIIFCGAMFSDYVTVGWTAPIPYEKSIIIALDHVHVQKRRFSYIFLSTVISRLCGCLSKKGNFLQGRIEEVSTTGQEKSSSSRATPDTLQLGFIQDELQFNVGSGKYTSVVAETGDSWFIAEKLKIPGDTNFFIQMQYGSIGWALAACLGVGLVTKELGGNKVLALIGDGSFQVAVQELSTIIEEDLDVTIIVMNNASYAIEEQINPGVYNQVVNWKYAELIKVFGGGEPLARSFVCETNEDFKKALAESYEHSGVSLVECRIDKNDCTMELREWGEKVAAANQRA
ncbi:alpha-keto acid decarboxylase family protein [archaeon]|nr:MAG: alpha-keto acid decarboxylase family protein [archaeon]